MLRDTKGREICVGDVLKVYHFTGPRRRVWFMYKIVAEWRGHLYAVCCSELAVKQLDIAHKYRLTIEADAEGYVRGTEIVQGHGPGEVVCYTDRPRVKQLAPGVTRE